MKDLIRQLGGSTTTHIYDGAGIRDTIGTIQPIWTDRAPTQRNSPYAADPVKRPVLEQVMINISRGLKKRDNTTTYDMGTFGEITIQAWDILDDPNHKHGGYTN